MAVTHWECGEATQTTACVVVRCNSTESVTVVAAGQTKTANCDTSVKDGNARVDFTGLSAGQTYPYTINGTAAGTLRTAPVEGVYPFWVALSSCWALASVDVMAYALVTEPATAESRDTPAIALQRELVRNLKAAFGLGDQVYKDGGGTHYGYVCQPMNGSTLSLFQDVTEQRQLQRARKLQGGLKSLIRAVPWYEQNDDHDYDPDNACPASLAYAQRVFGGGTSDADRIAWATACQTALDDWQLGQPTRRGSSNYFKVRLGNIEFFVTDLISGRDDYSATPSSSKRLMSAAQEEQFLADIAASTAAFKCWLSTKQFISSIGRNGDGWYNLDGGTSEGYEHQLGRILADSRIPRGGFFSVTGDEHIRSDMFIPADRFATGGVAVSQISAGPATIEPITDPNDGLTYRAGVVSKARDTSGLGNRDENNYVCLRVLADRVERYRFGSRNGLVYEGYISTADNAVRR